MSGRQQRVMVQPIVSFVDLNVPILLTTTLQNVIFKNLQQVKGTSMLRPLHNLTYYICHRNKKS